MCPIEGSKFSAWGVCQVGERASSVDKQLPFVCRSARAMFKLICVVSCHVYVLQCCMCKCMSDLVYRVLICVCIAVLLWVVVARWARTRPLTMRR